MNRTRIGLWAAALLALSAVGCAPGIGDACTTDQECGGRTCINTDGFAGGYCTQRCIYGDASTCPVGASCINHRGSNLCLRACSEDSECRSGYRCKNYKLQGTFCLAPDDD